MTRERQLPSLVTDQLKNYDLTRKIFAIRTLEIMTLQIEAEAAKPTPDRTIIANLGTAIAAVLASVG